jgi:4,5-dihydroxyphthalate decarboxylase
MSRLPITIATWDYDRVRALADGRVRVEGCNVNYITMPVEECFERAYFHGEFEVAEIGFSPYLIALSRGTPPYVAVPAFLSRMFRHSAIYIRADRGIESPSDLKGKRIGVPEYQMSAVMWLRGFLKDEFKIAAHDINWVQGGLENPGRREKFLLNLPQGFPLSAAPESQSLSQMLADGTLDAVMAARRPSCFVTGAACSQTIARSSATTSDAPACSRSCTRWACAATCTRNIPGWLRRSTRRSRRPSASPTRNLPKPPRSRSGCLGSHGGRFLVLWP